MNSRANSRTVRDGDVIHRRQFGLAAELCLRLCRGAHVVVNRVRIPLYITYNCMIVDILFTRRAGTPAVSVLLASQGAPLFGQCMHARHGYKARKPVH